MTILGIDWGESKIGLAISEGIIAEPLGVVKTTKWQSEIVHLFDIYKFDQVVVGISEGLSAERTQNFVRNLKDLVRVPVILEDETLTTMEAQKIVRARKVNEDAVAAALILQSYLDKHTQSL